MSEIKDLKPFEQRSKPKFTYPDGKEVYGELFDEVYVDSKVINENTTGVVYKYLIQKISLENGEEVFRFCYYVINFDDTEPKWMFSKNALIVLEKELKELLNKIKEKGWI